MRDLKRYRQKRDPERTPEPFGDEARGRPIPPGGARRFVVQQHAARSLHWDLRLEIEGVLVSFAVPRGPSLDPAERRLAVQTEDHPLEYAEFEGVIPAGNYGAGAMIVWDDGRYRSVDGVAPADGLAKGKLDLELSGHKLRGRFALVRTKGEPAGRSWLLLHKSRRTFAPPDVVEAAPESVLSGRTVAEVAAGADREAAVAEAIGDLDPPAWRGDAAELRPMLASNGEGPFSDPAWRFELKYDGVRLLASRESRDAPVVLRTRTGRDRTDVYPEVAAALTHLPVGAFVIDGEVVSLDETGRSSFERLQRRFAQTDPDAIARARVEAPAVFQVFDLLAVSGRDLRACALDDRKRILAAFAPRGGVVRFVDHVEGDGEALFEAAREHGLEGVIAKRGDARYEAGRRSPRWLKLKVPRSATLAIVGWAEGQGSRRSLGSLALAWQRDGRLVYAGQVGSGLSEEGIARLLPQLEATRVGEPPCDGVSETARRRLHWVTPEWCCEVGYTEVTRTGQLRHPVFQGLREDVGLDDCRAPADDFDRSALSEAAPARRKPAGGLALSRLDKVFWPVEGYTKGDLLAYYERIWPWLAPYLRDRPLVLTRYPDGIEGKHFYQKNAPDFTPEWVQRASIEGTDYFICNELDTLRYVINSGAIALHVWHSRTVDLEHPDWVLLDLDPKQAPFGDVVRVARHLHKLLDACEAPHFVKTSGQDGLHVMLPLAGQLDHGEARQLAEALSRVVAAELPDRATLVRPLARRADKVYLDYLQNGRGKLVAAPFSVRPRPSAPVSTPLTWGQVTSRLDPVRWNLRTTPRRMKAHGDPMAGLLSAELDVERLLSHLGERMANNDPAALEAEPG
ncbi:MAG: DNA ligase D [Myxococcales bacterium]|nr:DNA ligase D [Myxococcales bacterium]